MSEVWSYIVFLIRHSVQALKSIPIWQGNGFTVSVWEFSIALLLLTIVSVALVSSVRVAPGMAYTKASNERKAAERQKAADARREARRAERKK